MNTKEVIIFRKKIMKGLELSFQRLLAQKQKDDEMLVFSRNGKVEVVRARELKVTAPKKIATKRRNG